ncbi:hypothetical protein MTR67_023589 [Solanum verrucosum]|uniref:Reverse transcriptase zinc-binding domain-containing protein n=1 Tax=Solanum verrucosum TaxID=315347 RepID=A0AAF0TSA8_SOLVR|nr:hypothetical protein MTR67_023589 [Solanum verrucosum]
MEDQFGLNTTTISQFLVGGNWNETMVRQWVPPLLIPKIFSFPIHYQEQTPDEAIWKLTVDGLFSCSSAWEHIRNKGTKSIINKGIWHRHLPFKISFLVWRTLRNKLPTNEKLTSFGKEADHCFCCYRTGEDNIDHIFISGHFANKIWSFFSVAAGILHDHILINMLMLRWWRQEHKIEVQNLLNQLLPLIIIWNLWKNRCATKYGEKQSNIARNFFLILKDTTHLLNTAFPYIQWANDWTDLFRMVEKCRQETMVRIVEWEKPSQHFLQLDTDGSALSNPRKIGGGGILRDHQGKLIYAFVIPLGTGTNNQAEFQAASHGIFWCIQMAIRKFTWKSTLNWSLNGFQNNSRSPGIYSNTSQTTTPSPAIGAVQMHTHLQRGKQHG